MRKKKKALMRTDHIFNMCVLRAHFLPWYFIFTFVTVRMPIWDFFLHFPPSSPALPAIFTSLSSMRPSPAFWCRLRVSSPITEPFTSSSFTCLLHIVMPLTGGASSEDAKHQYAFFFFFFSPHAFSFQVRWVPRAFSAPTAWLLLSDIFHFFFHIAHHAFFFTYTLHCASEIFFFLSSAMTHFLLHRR